MKNNENASKYAFITGAGSGIGAEVARRLDQTGYQLILSGSNRSKLETFSKSLTTAPIIEVANLSDRDDVQNLCDKLRNEYAGLDIAFINAGVVKIGSFADRASEAIDQEIDVNLRSALHLIQACIPGMKARNKGHILATSSIGGTFALQGSSVYSATKFALRGFLSALQQELIEDGINVSGIYPGAIDTEMLRHEAVSGGSALNFLNEPQPVEAVADAFMKTLKTGQLETYIPYSDSITSRILGSIPWIIPKIYKHLKKSGEKGRAKFIASRNLNL